MPSEPTVEEVENLLDDIQHWGSIDDSRIPLKTRTMLVALCRHFLAQAAAPQMTAGEFAGLVIHRAGMAGLAATAFVVRRTAAEHNIEIVEPKK